jgi:cation transport ATPase
MITLLVVALAGLFIGLALRLQGVDAFARAVWAAGVVPVLAALLLEILRSLRHGEVGLDIVAALSMSAALFFGEALAAAVVAVMYAGGTFLESFAEARARREMRDLLSRVPRTATRHRDGVLEDIPLEEIAPGDRLLIRQGDVAPVDGIVDSESDAGTARPRSRSHERLNQCRRGVRPTHIPPRGREHICRYRSIG